jgi:hypothetical protein
MPMTLSSPCLFSQSVFVMSNICTPVIVCCKMLTSIGNLSINLSVNVVPYYIILFIIKTYTAQRFKVFII